MHPKGRCPVPERLDLASDLEFPAQTGQMAFSPPSNSSPSPFMQFAASMASQGTCKYKIHEFFGNCKKFPTNGDQELQQNVNRFCPG